MNVYKRVAKGGVALLASLAAWGLAGAAPAVALTTTEEVSHYSATPTLSTSTTTTAKSSTSEVAPKEEEAKPKHKSKPKEKQETKPTSTTSTPVATTTTSTSAVKAKALPFTGFNLTWPLVGGLVLLASGLGLRLATRRR